MTALKIGRYEIIEEIGRGGMATVFRAFDPFFQRDVALKVIPREFLHDPTFRSRFQREAKTVALLEHPAIVPVYDVGEEDDQPYLVMRYLPGGSLADRLKQGEVSFEETCRIVNRLAPALDEAHKSGVI
ncbi:MAG TPA: serine/threonine-protein kinase, partial [Anaerolineae bacterium]|nr:serine/threonine-protein kinase [Anaerolineae bacterium]